MCRRQPIPDLVPIKSVNLLYLCIFARTFHEGMAAVKKDGKYGFSK
jgi:hypothetical protein